MTDDPIMPAATPAGNQISLEPLGDQGILARTADEAAAVRLAATLRQNPPAWLEDVVQAYLSVAVFYDSAMTCQADVLAHVERLRDHPGADPGPGTLHEIPCCYELGPDLERVATATGLSPDAVVVAHSATVYTVYAIGFCPGFPYLGYLPPSLQGVPRLPTPRTQVPAGSVGLTGRQTGIYTEARPGGWNLIGQTPLLLVDVATGYFPLRTGDRVRFAPIGRANFAELAGRRLETGHRSG
jgi:inhibitor of KinA